MKKVLVLTTTYPLNEEDTQPRFIESLCKELTKNHQVTLLAPSIKGNRGSLSSGASINVIRYRYFFAKFETLCGGDGILENLKRSKGLFLLVPFLLVSQLVQTIRICRKQKIDVIHAHWLLPQGLTAVIASLVLKRKVKVLVTSHGGDLYALQGKLATRLKKFVLKQCDHITVVSRAMKTYCAEQLGAPTCKISVASMGVDLKETFVPKGEKDKQRLVFVGRLAEKKGVDVLIKAMAILKSRPLNFHLDIVGGGARLEEYQSLADDLGLAEYVQFHGAVNNDSVVKYLQRAKVAVFPFKIAANGDQEGLGLTMVEAMGCGCVVIASDLPAVRDVIVDGVNGLLVEPNNEEKLAEIIDFARSKACNSEELVIKALATSFRKFDWESIGQSYSQLIAGL